MPLADDYLEFQRLVGAKGVIFSFVGFMSEGILYSLGEALKQKMTLDAADANVTRRVFAIFVEQVQNIIRYSSERARGDVGKPVELSSGMISVGREQDRFFVVCGNVMAARAAIELDRRLTELAGMDPDSLKRLYREKLREPLVTDRQGGNVGLIEIARRSSRPIEFGFAPVAADRTFFCLKAFI